MKRVFVYGTLRGTGIPAKLIGFSKDTSAQFPTIYPDGDGAVDGEILNVSVHELAAMDRYEGYNPDRPERSLYVRMQISDGSYVYVANVETHGHWDVSYSLDEVRQQLREAEIVK